MKIRLHDGTLAPLTGWAPWTTTGDTVEKVLVVVEGVGNAFLSTDDFLERVVED